MPPCERRIDRVRRPRVQLGAPAQPTSGFVHPTLTPYELPGRNVFGVRFTAAITHEGEWYVARALEVEVTSQGRTSMRPWTVFGKLLSCTSKTRRSPKTSSRRSSPPFSSLREPGASGRQRRCRRGRPDDNGLQAGESTGQSMKLRKNGQTVIVPLHRELAPGTLRSILRQASLTPSEFTALL